MHEQVLDVVKHEKNEDHEVQDGISDLLARGGSRPQATRAMAWGAATATQAYGSVYQRYFTTFILFV
jgi:hypothetical protein